MNIKLLNAVRWNRAATGPHAQLFFNIEVLCLKISQQWPADSIPPNKKWSELIKLTESAIAQELTAKINQLPAELHPQTQNPLEVVMWADILANILTEERLGAAKKN